MHPSLSAVTSVSIPATSLPSVGRAAEVLQTRLGLPKASASVGRGSGLSISIGSDWLDAPSQLPADWLHVQLSADGTGSIAASSGSHLYALAHLIADGLLDGRGDELARGILIEPAFPFQRPLFDSTLTQVARTARGFDPEAYIESLARAGFTHLEVNGLATHVPLEPGTPHEYYAQFYSYCPGFNHFTSSSLTRGYYPIEYTDANLNRMRRLAELGRQYGLKPGMVTFEPRSMPEALFQRYPTLRGARIDHPFRSHLPRYTLAQDHPVAKEHYREVVRNIMQAVPDMSYISIWTNDSGAGFEHTASLYVGRNGGPFMIREWRDHDQIAATAAKSAIGWLRLIRDAGAETNPDFEVLLRMEPFKVEHEALLAGMGDGVGVESPSLMVRGYELPYAHPKYPEQKSAAGTLFHDWMDDEEIPLLEDNRSFGVEPKITYSASSSFNTEPLLGTPFPRTLHRKLKAMQKTGFKHVSAFGGLLDTKQTPYWPNPEVIRAAQYTPDASIDDVLTAAAERFVGAEHAASLVQAWDAVEEAVSYLPIVPLYSFFGFVWLRTWVRPLVPDIEAVPIDDRRYYEQFMVSQANNPSINDLGRDVLFDLITKESGRSMADQLDANVLTRVESALSLLDGLIESTAGSDAQRAFIDLRDRTVALQCWATTQRNTCAWVAGVYTYLDSDSEEVRAEAVAYLQEMIDLDIVNTKRLIEHWETSATETFLVSDVGETSFIYGENIGDLMRRKLELTEQYRHHAPRIDKDIMWRLP